MKVQQKSRESRYPKGEISVLASLDITRRELEDLVGFQYSPFSCP
jgi:hypothetical protein